MSKQVLYPIVGTKSSLLWDEKTNAWTYLTNQPERKDSPRSYFKLVPTLYRATDKRAKAIAALPWAIVKGKEDYDTSENNENKTGLVSSMASMLWLIEAALTLEGKAYWKREKNAVGFDKLRHLDPTTLTLDKEKANKGELIWSRYDPVEKRDREYTIKEIVYIWGLDPYAEIGPPTSWPALAALNACGVLANLDAFAATYFGRGAIRAMLFAMQGTQKEQAEKFEKWWNRWIAGLGNAFRTKVINAEKVTPVVVGEGIKELENVTITQDKQEDVARALDIPASILFANAANYATAERDKLNWYEDFVVPEANYIAAELNRQVFEPMGLKFEFRPETLDIFQEDEEARAMALGYLFNAEVPLDIAMKILGFDLDDEQWARIEAQVERKEQQAEELVNQLTSGGNGSGAVGGNAPADPNAGNKPDPFVEQKAVDPQQLQRELSIWQKKCLSALKRDETAASVSFVPVHIPADVYERITGGLETAEDAEAVKGVFAGALVEPDGNGHRPGELASLLIELKRANDLLEMTSERNS